MPSRSSPFDLNALYILRINPLDVTLDRDMRHLTVTEGTALPFLVCIEAMSFGNRSVDSGHSFGESAAPNFGIEAITS
jgi:hypothetical protein